MLRCGEAAPGTLTDGERDELEQSRVRLMAIDDAVTGAVRGLAAARARRQEALAALRGRLLAAKAHVTCLAAMNGIGIPVVSLGKTAWKIIGVAPLAETYRQVLEASGADPLTRTVRDGLSAATAAFERADEEVHQKMSGLRVLRAGAHAEARRASGRATDLRTLMSLRTPRPDRRALTDRLSTAPGAKAA